MTKQEGDNNNNNIDSTSPSILKEQRQIVLNLYNSGIEPEVIAYQLDIGQEEVNRVIKEEEEEKKELEMKQKILDAWECTPPNWAACQEIVYYPSNYYLHLS